jgi:integrase
MSTTFGKLSDMWLQEVARQYRAGTLRNYSGSLKRLFEHDPELRDRAINRMDIIAWRDAMADSDVNLQSVNRHTKAIKACLRWGALLGLGHPEVELRRIALPLPPRRELVYTPDEASRVLAAASFDPPVLVILKIAHATGLRLGEILALRWCDIQDGAVHVVPKVDWQPKTAAAVRIVPAPELCEWLQVYRRGLRFKGDQDLVCQHRPGRPWGKRIHERLKRVMNQAGVFGKKPVHSFRHQLASELIEAGAPITATQRLLGHSNPNVLLAHYARASRAGLQGAMDALRAHRAGR